MREAHAFGSFVPAKATHLLLGSFPGKQAEWFYGTKRSQFWPIMEAVFGLELKTKAAKQKMLRDLRMAITDIILSCERRNDSNLDMNLANIIFNTKAITDIMMENKIEAIFFSSRFVETLFKRNFKNLIAAYPDIRLVTLPSPSPRYAAMTRAEKIARYRELLPKLK
jgi:hypoxanthine-DNA glycosylase